MRLIEKGFFNSISGGYGPIVSAVGRLAGEEAAAMLLEKAAEAAAELAEKARDLARQREEDKQREREEKARQDRDRIPQVVWTPSGPISAYQ